MDDEKTVKAWVTKYALTSGIMEVGGTISKQYAGLFHVPAKERGHFGQTFHGLDWHTVKADALDRAEEMRKAKIASLKKQIAKLEALEFK